MAPTTTPRARNVLTSEPPDEPAEPSARALSGDGRLSGLSSPGPLTVARAPDGSASASARLVAARNRERFTPLWSDGCPSALAAPAIDFVDRLRELRSRAWRSTSSIAYANFVRGPGDRLRRSLTRTSFAALGSLGDGDVPLGRRLLASGPARAGHVGHAQAELLVDDDDLAAGDDPPV